MQTLLKDFEEKDVIIIVISGDRDNDIKRFWNENDLSLTVLSDNNNLIANYYNVRRYPTGILINREGEEVYSSIGWGAASLEKLYVEIDENS